MNIHTLNDLAGNNNALNNNQNNLFFQNNQNNQNNQNEQNNQIFMPGFNQANGGQNGGIIDFLFPKEVYKMKTLSFLIICILIGVYFIQLILYYSIYKPNGYGWHCLLYHFGASETSAIVNHYQYFRLITPMFTHNNFYHLFSNIISILFIGFPVEYDLKNRTNYLLLFFISGIIGNFCSLLFTYDNITMGASGAILGFCGYYVLFFILNWDQMNYSQKCCSMIFFIIIFLNLTSGLTEGSSRVDYHSHIGGFIAGLAFGMFLTYRSQVLYRFPQNIMKLLFYLSIGFLVGLPLISIIVINLKDIPDNTEFFCLTQNVS